MTPTTPKISPASTMLLSMRCSRALTLRLNEPKSPAGLRPIRWSIISTGTGMPGSTNGRGVLRQAEHLPAVLQAIVALDAWNELSVLQHAPWLGRLLAASILREAGITTGAHLAAINLGLKTIPVGRRRNRDRETRLLAITHGLIAAAEIGLKEHDRLALARTLFERKLDGRRTSSKLPELVELVMAKPLVSAGMVAKTLDVTPQAARRIVLELGLREMTGRGRFRAWGVL